MKLITLGTSHGDPGEHRFCSALLLSTDSGDYLFEAGAPVNALMIRHKIPFSRLKAVFVSHSHEDHTGCLPGVIKSLTKRPEAGQHTAILLPEQSCIDGLLSFMASTHRPWPEELLSFKEIHSGKIFDDGYLQVTAYPTDHMSNEEKSYPSWAFLVECEGKRLVLTGDLSRDLHDFPLDAFDKPAICVMECQHYPAPLAGKILKNLPIERFIGVHISNRWDGHAEEFFQAIGRPAWPFAFARDGMEFDLSSPPSPRPVIALLADLHLPDAGDTVKEQVLDWAIQEMASRKVTHIVSAGDMTARGTYPAARRLRNKFKKLAGKFFHTPGNAEHRTLDLKAQNCLKTPVGDDEILLLDSSAGHFSISARCRLAELLGQNEKKNLLAVTHYPPQNLPQEDQALLIAANRLNVISLLVYGHMHHDKKHTFRGLPCEAVRGLDPDKASGGPPALVLFSRDHDGNFCRKNIPCPAADPRKWPQEQKTALLSHLGLSAMSDPLGTLRFAIKENVPVLEWRYARPPRDEWTLFQELLTSWRQKGKRCFSIHFPDVRWENDCWTGLDTLSQAVETALLLKADRITLHVPRITVGLFQDPVISNSIADQLAALLQVLVQNNVAIGIENLHMRSGEKDDQQRGFGYTPEEVFSFTEMLNQRGIPAGLHLDLGHARNNAPFSKRYNISDYFALYSSRINGCHLHQVLQDPTGKMLNHQALTEPYGKLISLGSLFMARRINQLPVCPLILEIRQGRGPESYLKLRDFLK